MIKPIYISPSQFPRHLSVVTSSSLLARSLNLFARSPSKLPCHRPSCRVISSLQRHRHRTCWPGRRFSFHVTIPFATSSPSCKFTVPVDNITVPVGQVPSKMTRHLSIVPDGQVTVHVATSHPSWPRHIPGTMSPSQLSRHLPDATSPSVLAMSPSQL